MIYSFDLELLWYAYMKILMKCIVSSGWQYVMTCFINSNLSINALLDQRDSNNTVIIAVFSMPSIEWGSNKGHILFLSSLFVCLLSTLTFKL